MNEYFAPCGISGEASGPPVTLWIVAEPPEASSLDHVTVSPTLMFSVGGLYCVFLIDTENVAADAGGPASPMPSMLSASAVVAANRRNVRDRRGRCFPEEYMRGK